MQGENRFIKLLLFSTAGGEVLLYGFSSPTNQPFLTWKQREISKKHQSVLTAILPFHEAEIFEKSLTQESTLSMAKITMKSPQLVIRPMVLVNDTHSRQHGPVVEYAYLKELWNVQKEALFQEILHSFGTDGKELYRNVQDLIQWCQEECGIDFSSQGHRFGNFEHYQSAPLGTGFKILTHKELELKKVTIQKTEVFSRELTRIPRTNLQLDIITCLGLTDPDTGKASDICKEYEKFLFSNAKLLHGRLSVRNLRRGNKPVFHDRYLLRFHNDQHIDGFLLSNSLNKMGQNYPFVIAPLEHEVALEVCEYLTQMFDAKLQEKKPPKERIICDVLYDSTVKPTAQDKKKLSPSPLKEWLGTEYCENGRNTIPKENLSVAVTEVWSHWGQDKEGVCRVLGELCSNVFRWSIEDVAETLKNIDGAADEFLMWFSDFAEEKERRMVHDQRGINAPEYTLWALLHDRATVSRAGFDILFDQAGHIWYRENGWFHGSYRLMLKLDPAAFLLLLDNSRSPLMFDILAARMSFYPWSERLFLSASKSKLLYTQLLCAQWMFSLFRDGKLSNKQVLDTLAQLTPQKRSLQTAYFLSQITFFTRTKHTLDSDAREQWEQLYQQLLSLLAVDLLHCSEQERNTALFWLYDNEQCSQCSLQLDLSRYIEDSTIRDAVLQKAVEGIQKYLIDSKYERNLKTAVDLYLTSAEQLYGGEVEKQILGKLVDWRTFERAAEPELKNYAYDKWHYAYIRAKWQLFLLAKYAQLHPGAEKTLKWLKEWRTRLPNIANEESGTNLTGS